MRSVVCRGSRCSWGTCIADTGNVQELRRWNCKWLSTPTQYWMCERPVEHASFVSSNKAGHFGRTAKGHGDV